MSNFDSGDERTLRLSALPLNPKQLESYIRYETDLLSALGGPNFQEPSAELFARAHTSSLASSGLTTETLEPTRSTVRRFTANRWSARKLRERLLELTDPEIRKNVMEELVRLDGDLAHRDGDATIGLLLMHEDTLLQLRDALGSWA
jgi:hypothetical protein